MLYRYFEKGLGLGFSKRGCFFMHPKNFLPAPPSFSKKTILVLLKITSRLLFPEYFQNIFSGIYFINYGFINLEIKNVFWKGYSRNDFLLFRFHILKITFTYETPILKSSKTVKRCFQYFEECRHAGRKM